MCHGNRGPPGLAPHGPLRPGPSSPSPPWAPPQTLNELGVAYETKETEIKPGAKPEWFTKLYHSALGANEGSDGKVGVATGEWGPRWEGGGFAARGTRMPARPCR